MREPDRTVRAWLPLTPRGVAAFGSATLGRLLLVQLGVSLVAAGALVWFLHHTWFQTLGDAIDRLPDRGEIRTAGLQWSGPSPQTLAEGRHLAVVVDLVHSGEARLPAHVQVQFGQADFRVYSLLGCWSGRYPRGWVVSFNRPELKPWWGAWAPVLLAGSAAGAVVGLLLVWALLATAYAPVAWLVAWFADRSLSLRGGGKLAGAALMPGALFLSVVIVAYGLGALDVVQLMAAVAVHLVLGWIYLLAAPFYLPRMGGDDSLKANPFGAGPGTKPGGPAK